MEKSKIEKIIKEIIMNNIENNDSSEFLDMNLTYGNDLANISLKKAVEKNIQISVSIVDRGGNLVVFKRMDDAILGSILVSQKKAQTSLILNKPTSQIDLKEFPYLDKILGNDIILFGGGYPIVYQNRLIGAIGISGSTAENDEMIAFESVQQFLDNYSNKIIQNRRKK